MTNFSLSELTRMRDDQTDIFLTLEFAKKFKIDHNLPFKIDAFDLTRIRVRRNDSIGMTGLYDNFQRKAPRSHSVLLSEVL